MKTYVYTKGNERITVETDAFGSIDNFMITGVHRDAAYGLKDGEKLDNQLVHDGLYFTHGYAATKAEMKNVAEKCGATLKVYNSGVEILEEAYTPEGNKDEDNKKGEGEVEKPANPEKGEGEVKI